MGAACGSTLGRPGADQRRPDRGQTRIYRRRTRPFGATYVSAADGSFAASATTLKWTPSRSSSINAATPTRPRLTPVHAIALRPGTNKEDRSTARARTPPRVRPTSPRPRRLTLSARDGLLRAWSDNYGQRCRPRSRKPCWFSLAGGHGSARSCPGFHRHHVGAMPVWYSATRVAASSGDPSGNMDR